MSHTGWILLPFKNMPQKVSTDTSEEVGGRGYILVVEDLLGMQKALDLIPRPRSKNKYKLRCFSKTHKW